MTSIEPARPQPILVFAPTTARAQHWADEHGLAPARWTHVTGLHGVRGRRGARYIVLGGPGVPFTPAVRDALQYLEQVGEGVYWTPEQPEGLGQPGRPR